MYIAAVRLADEFGCAAIGIQYQQGLKDLAPASDLAEGLLNNVDRPPVKCARTGRVLFAGEAVPHFNEVDECAGLDGLVTYRFGANWGFRRRTRCTTCVGGALQRRWRGRVRLGIPDFPARRHRPILSEGTRAHGASDSRRCISGLRWNLERYFQTRSYCLEPCVHHERQLHCDLGIGRVVELPLKETERRWKETTPQWPINARGPERDYARSDDARHNQIIFSRVCPNEQQAHRALRSRQLCSPNWPGGHLCGDVCWIESVSMQTERGVYAASAFRSERCCGRRRVEAA